MQCAYLSVFCFCEVPLSARMMFFSFFSSFELGSEDRLLLARCVVAITCYWQTELTLISKRAAPTRTLQNVRLNFMRRDKPVSFRLILGNLYIHTWFFSMTNDVGILKFPTVNHAVFLELVSEVRLPRCVVAIACYWQIKLIRIPKKAPPSRTLQNVRRNFMTRDKPVSFSYWSICISAIRDSFLWPMTLEFWNFRQLTTRSRKSLVFRKNEQTPRAKFFKWIILVRSQKNLCHSRFFQVLLKSLWYLHQ